MKELKRILLGKMETLQIEKCPHRPVPKYPELSVDAVYEKFSHDADTMKYLPLKVEGKRKPDRNFVFDVV
jgi:hypothetical protein